MHAQLWIKWSILYNLMIVYALEHQNLITRTTNYKVDDTYMMTDLYSGMHLLRWQLCTKRYTHTKSVKIDLKIKCMVMQMYKRNPANALAKIECTYNLVNIHTYKRLLNVNFHIHLEHAKTHVTPKFQIACVLLQMYVRMPWQDWK